MVKLANMLNRLKSERILVAGDMMLDSYTIGKVRRISPEAPVAVVNVLQEDHRPGGAGNVILNLISLGAKVSAIGRIGADPNGQMFLDALNQEGVDTRMIAVQDRYHTPVKNRIIADNQQIVRIDREEIVPLSEPLEQMIIDQLGSLLDGVRLVAISDYGKGFLTPVLLSALISKAGQMGIPVITDPKGTDFKKYQGTTLIKPNLSEAYAAAHLPRESPLEPVAAAILSQSRAEILMLTRSEEGISLFHQKGGRSDFPVLAKEVKDVTGAGDTVLAMLSYALASGLDVEEAAELCNIAAGIAIEHVGCARVTLSDLALRLFEQNMNCKVFDQEHFFVLAEVVKKRPYHLLKIARAESLTPALYQAIKEIYKTGESLLVYLEDAAAPESLIEMLSSLQEINFILLHLDNLKSLFHAAQPQSVYAFDGSSFKSLGISLIK